MNKQLMILAIGTISMLASCKKEDSSTPKPATPASGTATTPVYGSGDGAVVALITRTTTATPIGNMDYDLGTGVAVFGNLSTGTYSDAGKITLNGKELARQTNNSYLYTPTAGDMKGIDLSGSIKWTVTTPSFTYDAGAGTGRGMPAAKSIAGAYTSVDASAAFTLEVDGAVSNSDSVYFQINGPSKSVLKRMAANTRSVTFTAAEMGTLGKGAGCSVTIAPWNHQEKTLGGKLIHVVNELALSRVIEIK